MVQSYSKEGHDKCKAVAEAFRELYDMLGDTCVLDAGEFGFVYLTNYMEQKSSFDGNQVYCDVEELFEDLWLDWLYNEVLRSGIASEDEDFDFEEVYNALSVEKKQEYAEKRQDFLDLAGLTD